VAAVGGHTVALWDTQTGQTRATLKHNGSPCGAAFAPDGTAVVSAGGVAVTLWDARTGKQRWSAETGHVNSAVFLPDGKAVAVAEWHAQPLGRGWDLEVCLSDAETGKKTRTLKR
jgi:WD40 repeat protein